MSEENELQEFEVNQEHAIKVAEAVYATLNSEELKDISVLDVLVGLDTLVQFVKEQAGIEEFISEDQHEPN